MRNLSRTIEEVRELRGDLSSYLVHLTREGSVTDLNGTLVHYSARDSLLRMLEHNEIIPLKGVGQFRATAYVNKVKPDDVLAVCLTETPIDQLYLFQNIKNRGLKFGSYGLVFSADELARAPIRAAPVLYFSQPTSGDFFFVDQFKKLVEPPHYQAFKDILYLYDRFGKSLGSGSGWESDYNFRWEREWRIKSKFQNIKQYVKFGLCPEQDIAEFEKQFSPLKFVDPFFHPQQIRSVLLKSGVKV